MVLKIGRFRVGSADPTRNWLEPSRFLSVNRILSRISSGSADPDRNWPIHDQIGSESARNNSDPDYAFLNHGMI